MPNHVQAAAEGLPKISRRKAMALATGGVFTVAALSAPVPKAVAAVEDSLDAPIAENPWERAHRLTAELSDALAEINDGQFYAHVYPNNSNHPTKVWYCGVHVDKDTARERLDYHGRMFQRAAMDIDPTLTEWGILEAVDKSIVIGRISLIGSRKAVRS